MFGQVLLLTLALTHLAAGKYVEGHLKTTDDWAFLARFCFLSGHGRYEYVIEYERRHGELQLLLYYDSPHQWPAVYKTKKTCEDKLAVLSVRDNQIVTLTPHPPNNFLSGCTLRTSRDDPTTTTTTSKPPKAGAGSGQGWAEADPGYFDQFLKTSTMPTSITTMDDANETVSETTSETPNEEWTTVESIRSGLGKDMKGFENRLENGTDFKVDVEEMFPTNSTRVRRAAGYPQLFGSDRKGTIIVSCHNIGGFTSSRERWWYIAISNCGSRKGLDVHYRFRMTNGPPGDFWYEHFSADEMYIPPVLLTETIAYCLLLLAIFICAIELKNLHLYHCTYRLFAFSALSQWFGVLMEEVTWAKYALTGLGPHRVLGGIFMGASEISFMLLLLLMAKGYTITRARLSTCSTVKITVFINSYIVTYICLYVYQAEVFDPGEVLNLYESPAGFGLAGLRCIAWGAFIVSCATTIKKYPEKSAFYYPFGFLGSLWILSGPLITFVGVNVLDAWVRESVMCAALGIIAYGGHVAFLWLTWPSRANKSFPYHVRTNHVGIASDDDGLDYPRHPYEPAMTDQNIIIPLSRRTEELINGAYTQYLREQACYNSGSNPLSHLSFPPPPSGPPPPASAPDSSELSPSSNPPPPLPSRGVHLYKNGDANRNNNETTGSQNDSGHPSFEASNSAPNSPNVDTTSPPSTGSPRRDQAPQSNPQSATSNSSTKPNPFLAGAKPNKVILEPIEMPLRSSNGVPRHLFAAKQPAESTTNALNAP